jgi:hypothetical protein
MEIAVEVTILTMTESNETTVVDLRVSQNVQRLKWSETSECHGVKFVYTNFTNRDAHSTSADKLPGSATR